MWGKLLLCILCFGFCGFHVKLWLWEKFQRGLLCDGGFIESWSGLGWKILKIMEFHTSDMNRGS